MLAAFNAQRLSTCLWFASSARSFWAPPSGTRGRRLFATNALAPVESLQNTFYALRHGQSQANVAGLIASNPAVACQEYGLSHLGQQQATVAGEEVVEAFQAGTYSSLVLLSSDLLRARQTAQVVAEVALAKQLPVYESSVVVETRLRERWFGDFDLTSDDNYQRVWDDDAKDSSHTVASVESVDAVMQRATLAVLEWDARLSSSMIVCVAHGDVLQILQTAFEKMPGTAHRSLEHLETAKLRPLKLANR